MKSQDWTVSVFLVVVIGLLNGILVAVIEIGLYLLPCWIVWTLLSGRTKRSVSGARVEKKAEEKESPPMEGVQTTSIGG